MKKTAFSFVLVFCIASTTTHAQLANKYPASYSEKTFRSMAYGFFKPAHIDSKKKYPLVVYLHGANDLVSRDLIWYQESVQKENPLFVLSPKCKEANQGWGNTWTDQHSTATANTLALVDSLIKTNQIDTDRLYVYGISMGGFGVFSILQKEQGKFAAAYAICGGSDSKAAPSLLQTPLWIFHGTDDDVVPVHLSRDVYQEMKNLGGTKVKYTEYPGVKHNSWENAARETALIPWLLSHRKGE
ncbi:MAG: prolyl oligopeptidase family serine peptidase [Bacteroidota bacterium]